MNDKRFARCHREISSRQLSQGLVLHRVIQSASYASRFEIIPVVPAPRRKSLKNWSSLIRNSDSFPRRRRRYPEYLPGYQARVTNSHRRGGLGPALARENSNVTLKVVTREYYKRKMSRWERTCCTYVCGEWKIAGARVACRSPKCTHLFTPVRRHNVSYVMLFLPRRCENKCETFKRLLI